jgi:hypothetical protein
MKKILIFVTLVGLTAVNVYYGSIKPYNWREKEYIELQAKYDSLLKESHANYVRTVTYYRHVIAEKDKRIQSFR